MAEELTREQALAEAYRRGILPPDMRSAYEQAMSRGLVPKVPQGGNVTEQGLDAAKAFGSGAVHEGLPSVMGIPAAVADLGGWDRHGLPDTEQSKEIIKNVIPEYQPKNKGESLLKEIGGYAPAAVAGPEMLAPRAVGEGLASRFLLKPAAEIARTAAAPVAANHGVENYYPTNWPYKDQVQLGATMLAPAIAGRGITPRPAKNPEWLGMVNALKGDVNLMPGQKVGTSRSAGMDAFLASQPMSGTSWDEIRQGQNAQFGAGAMRRMGAGSDATPSQAGAAKLGNTIDSEFNRLTSAHSIPFTSGAQNAMNKAVQDFEKSSLNVKDKTQLAQEMRDTIAEMDNLSMQNRTTPGFLTGDQYQNWRSQLGAKAGQGDNESNKVYRAFRDALDNTMEQTLHMTAPHDVGAFQKARSNYADFLALKNVLAGNKEVTPENLSHAIAKTQGDDTMALGRTPLSQYSRAGEHVLGVDPDVSRGEKALSAITLPIAIGAGDAAGSTAANMGGINPLLGALMGGGAAGGAAVVTQGIPSLIARGLFTKVPGTEWSPMQSYLGNQVLQKTPLLKKVPSHGLVGNEAASKKDHRE